MRRGSPYIRIRILPCNGARLHAMERKINAPREEPKMLVRGIPCFDQGFTGEARIMAWMEMFPSFAIAAANSAAPPPWELPRRPADFAPTACMKASTYCAKEARSPVRAGFLQENPEPGRSMA